MRSSGLEPALVELVKLRASYLNGCAYCVDMHTRAGRAVGRRADHRGAVTARRPQVPFTERGGVPEARPA